MVSRWLHIGSTPVWTPEHLLHRTKQYKVSLRENWPENTAIWQIKVAKFNVTEKLSNAWLNELTGGCYQCASIWNRHRCHLRTTPANNRTMINTYECNFSLFKKNKALIEYNLIKKNYLHIYKYANIQKPKYLKSCNLILLLINFFENILESTVISFQNRIFSRQIQRIFLHDRILETTMREISYGLCLN